MNNPQIIGGASFWLGDCLEVMAGLPDDSVDLIITSPPYDNLRTYEGQQAFTMTEFKAVALRLYAILKPGGVLVWIIGDETKNGSETGTSFRQALYFKDIGFNLHDTMIFQKKNPMPGIGNGVRYTPTFEFMLVFSIGLPKTFNPIQKECIGSGNTYNGEENWGREKDGKLKKWKKNKGRLVKKTRDIGNIWTYAVGGLIIDHPAIFPEKLARDHIISWSNEGDTVLDCFMGSGSTAIACHRTGRKFIGIEKEKKYFEIAVARYRSEIKQLRLCDL